MLHQTLKNAMQEALKNKESTKLTTLRSIVAAATNELVSLGRTPQDALTDEEMLKLIKRLAKQRKESIEQFEQGGRVDLAEKERSELAILETYLPPMLSEAEIRALATAKKTELAITDPQQKGMLMGALMKELADNADGRVVKKVVDELI